MNTKYKNWFVRVGVVAFALTLIMPGYSQRNQPGRETNQMSFTFLLMIWVMENLVVMVSKRF
jgi:hypothetical protein